MTSLITKLTEVEASLKDAKFTISEENQLIIISCKEIKLISKPMAEEMTKELNKATEDIFKQYQKKIGKIIRLAVIERDSI